MPFTINTVSMDWASTDLDIIYRDPDTSEVKRATTTEIDADSALREQLVKTSLGIDTEAPVATTVRSGYTAGSGAGLVSNGSGDYNPGGGVGVGSPAYDTTSHFGVLFVPGA